MGESSAVVISKAIMIKHRIKARMFSLLKMLLINFFHMLWIKPHPIFALVCFEANTESCQFCFCFFGDYLYNSKTGI